jgi:hypothetical protein
MWFRLPISANSGISRGVAALAQPVEHRFRNNLVAPIILHIIVILQ